ncbi:hypothetical protein HanRHA438_Chr04g0185341 [Helianthus annuus]|uniref:Transmembrane protein n=1 Tax=Helianthus annuus TaxID=4232 RepID=A0A251UZ28_HELAN|nr:hypothetical protein HanXRQr2_Chr04g0175741 [Helianthus annuus]KAJ0581693.1 hypothetical protein HanHA300_Chr04g0144001 [Helianthus annuus]KAJ0758302.1 hypothetical protein HanLR1_Chr04g0148861 [Helianthus annuus]KAJ0761962.1 hypothetical protein HanOQP8_Chr04g0156071 [Helianthus annuus]KAJ0927656.1 hypothetical protein HanRHA438_Chr04g0185341 [Helianthus annuus]
MASFYSILNQFERLNKNTLSSFVFTNPNILSPLFFHPLPLNPNFSFISCLFPSSISFLYVQSFIYLTLITIPFHLLHILLLLYKIIQSRSTALRSLTPFDSSAKTSHERKTTDEDHRCC